MSTSQSEYRRNAQELEGFADAYPWSAVTDSGVKVHQTVRDQSVSRLTNPGVRSWRFKTVKDRDVFVDTVPTAERAGL
jgi:hypothetical protein